MMIKLGGMISSTDGLQAEKQTQKRTKIVIQ